MTADFKQTSSHLLQGRLWLAANKSMTVNQLELEHQNHLFISVCHVRADYDHNQIGLNVMTFNADLLEPRMKSRWPVFVLCDASGANTCYGVKSFIASHLSSFHFSEPVS